jgi:hypothetical protein
MPYAAPENVPLHKLIYRCSQCRSTEISLVNTLDLKWLIKTFPAVIATYILGGDFNSYLNMNLREEHGWTYGASTVIGAGMFQN